MIPKLNITCGPSYDIRTFNMSLSYVRRKIGVLVSGGLDSALLYYLLRSMVNVNYTVTPFTITRNDGSNIHAQLVIDYVNSALNKEKQTTTLLYINEPDSNMQVVAGMKEILKQNVNITYIGLIETLNIHCINVPRPYVPTDSDNFVYPFKNLNKSHIVDLVGKLQQQELFNITHSCVSEKNRCGLCNRCNERSWAFTQLGLSDTGTY